MQESHGREFAGMDLGIGLTIDDTVFIHLSDLLYDLVTLIRGDIQAGSGVEAGCVVGDYGFFSYGIADKHGFEMLVDTVLHLHGTDGVKVDGDVERCGQKGVAPRTSFLKSVMILGGTRQEIDGDSNYNYEKHYSECELARWHLIHTSKMLRTIVQIMMVKRMERMKTRAESMRWRRLPRSLGILERSRSPIKGISMMKSAL